MEQIKFVLSNNVADLVGSFDGTTNTTPGSVRGRHANKLADLDMRLGWIGFLRGG